MKGPTPEDIALWKLFSEGIKRLTKTKTDFATPRPAHHLSSPAPKRDIVIPGKPRGTSQPLVTLEARDLKAISIDGRLDLHGHTLERAQASLGRFMNASQQMNRRWVLVISGKGLHSADGRATLKTFVQEWFRQNTHLVVGFAESKPQDGGAGAFYVKVRRLRIHD
ncbi:Smr/MutS family protein [Candidatus Finniella inopinata]|uniref:Smr domain-containing protein n=1 Tax=Candidatus Finniella inopinata TaxID=1696036 RepID=A0A4Q7DIJ2_9PROT|nr:Smr/MutS family protein [Candidatus Finniella inopinata]RZI46542.1 hypothetical protein EQU50_02850 [Candidatus Finniella inopinata]